MIEETTIKLDVYPEYDEYWDDVVVHNHIDCPVCQKNNVGTNAYLDLHDMVKNDKKIRLKCENCGAEFLLISTKNAWDLDAWEWKIIFSPM